MPEERDLQEVLVDDRRAGGERLEEGLAEVGALAAAGLGAAQAYYARASYVLQRDEAAARAARDEFQRDLHEQRRMQVFESGGLDALDEFVEWHLDGPFTGFGDFDDPFAGFGGY